MNQYSGKPRSDLEFKLKILEFSNILKFRKLIPTSTNISIYFKEYDCCQQGSVGIWKQNREYYLRRYKIRLWILLNRLVGFGFSATRIRCLQFGSMSQNQGLFVRINIDKNLIREYFFEVRFVISGLGGDWDVLKYYDSRELIYSSPWRMAWPNRYVCLFSSNFWKTNFTTTRKCSSMGIACIPHE